MATITSIETDNSELERLGCCTAGLTQFRMRLPVEDLEFGMRVDELDKPWLESTFLFQGFFIESDEDLEALRKECDHVYVTVTRQVSTKKTMGSTPVSKAKLFKWPSAQDSELIS